jgi:hypothetical protein
MSGLIAAQEASNDFRFSGFFFISDRQDKF